MNRYIIFAGDTETQTAYNDEKYFKTFSQYDVAYKKLDDKLRLDNPSTSDIVKARGRIKKIKEMATTAQKATCNEIVPYLVGYTYTGYVTSGYNVLHSNVKIPANSDVIRLNENKILKKIHDEQSDIRELNEIKYFFSFDNNHSSIIKMLDDIVNNYQNFINRDKGDYTALIYFHNLKFDIQLFLYQQFIKHKELFNDKYEILYHNNEYYTFSFIYKDCRFELRDSYKILTQPIKKLGKLVGLNKLDDENTYNFHNLQSTDEMYKELKYFKNDILILKRALTDVIFKNNKKLRLTIGAYSYSSAKELIINKHKKPQSSIFIEEYCKTKDYKEMTSTERSYYKKQFFYKYEYFYEDAYSGGFVYVKPEIIGKILKNGITYDVNSLYPSVMLNRDYPNIFKEKELTEEKFNQLMFLYDTTKRHDLFYGIAHIKVNRLKLKKNGIPCFPKRWSYGNEDTNKDRETRKPITSLKGIRTRNNIVCLNLIDLYHIEQNYHIEYDFIDGIYYGEDDMLYKPFKNFVKPLKEQKERLSSNDPMRLLVKLKLNNLYGKFGQKDNTSKTKVLSPESIISIDDYSSMSYFKEFNKNATCVDEIKPYEIKNMLLADAVTAYARDVLLSTMETINKTGRAVVAYCDTDSIHVYPTNNKESQELFSKLNFNGSVSDNQKTAQEIAHALNIEYDQSELGKWKDEQYMSKGVYLANKKYWEIDPVHDKEHPNIIKCAGISPEGRDYIEEHGITNYSKIDVDGVYIPTKTRTAYKSGVRLEIRYKKIRSEQ